MASADVKFVEETLRSWNEELLHTAGPSGRGNGDERPSGGAETGRIAGVDVAAGSEARRTFVPSEEQVRVAMHLGSRLELARSVAAGVREKIADLEQRLDAQAREVARSKEDLALAKRRLHRARHGGRSVLAQLPLGADAGAAPSVYDSSGADLVAAVSEASKDSAKAHALEAALIARKTLVTSELLALSSALAETPGDARPRAS